MDGPWLVGGTWTGNVPGGGGVLECGGTKCPIRRTKLLIYRNV